MTIRNRQAKNFMASLLLSQGVPMILSGDEVLRTQRGNNNAYCQDNEVTWIDWQIDARGERLLEYTIRLMEIRRSNPVLRRRSFFGGRPDAGGAKDVTWLRPDGVEMAHAEWHDAKSHVLGMLIDGGATDEIDARGRPIEGDTLLLALNGGGRARVFQLPRVGMPGSWSELVRTSSPEKEVLPGGAIHLAPHSLVLLRFDTERRGRRRRARAATGGRAP
jgi:glycogen operon protein